MLNDKSFMEWRHYGAERGLLVEFYHHPCDTMKSATWVDFGLDDVAKKRAFDRAIGQKEYIIFY